MEEELAREKEEIRLGAEEEIRRVEAQRIWQKERRGA